MALYQPYVFAGMRDGDNSTVSADIKSRLEGAGFAVVGEGSPFENAYVITFTSDALKSLSSKSINGGFGAVLRVSLTQRDGQVEVSYNNPTYMAFLCRMDGDNADVTAKLAEVLGNEGTFGHSKGMDEKKIRGYHYKIGMPYFNEPQVLKKFESHEAALSAVRAGLEAKKGGCNKVYEVALPDKEEVVFGAFLSEGKGGDEHVMSIIDAKNERSHLAHLPYECLVSGNQLLMLKAKFRIAASFPSLDMVGSNGFTKIMSAPDAIKKAFASLVE